jgi:glycosyltransferase involved in cell wall biosynthesis
MRVGIMIRNLVVGGAQQHVVKLCQTIPEDKVKIDIILLSRSDQHILIGRLPGHIKVHLPPCNLHSPHLVPWLARLIRDQHFDLIHSFLWTADFYSSLTISLFGGPFLIGSERGDRTLSGYYDWYHNLLDRLFLFRIAKKICANSQFGRTALLKAGCPSEKIEVIANGVLPIEYSQTERVGIRSRLGWSENQVVIGTVSRLIEYKGIDTLIRALAIMKSDVCCVIVGDGPECQTLKKLSEDLHIERRIYFAGEQSNPLNWMCDFDIGVLTTRTPEHCSNAILEYMACGLPVVANKLGGNPELVVDGETGFLVSPNNPYSLAETLDMLAADNEMCKLFGTRGKKRIETTFHIDRVAERFYGLWERSIEAEIMNIQDQTPLVP